MGMMRGKGWLGRWVEESMSELGFVLVFDEWYGELRWVEWEVWVENLKKGGE